MLEPERDAWDDMREFYEDTYSDLEDRWEGYLEPEEEYDDDYGYDDGWYASAREYASNDIRDVVYLRDVGTTAEPCWVPCAFGDPGAIRFVQEG